MKNKKRLHICTGCGHEAMLAPNKKNWHNCHNPPFVYMVKEDYKLAHNIVQAYTSRKG